MRSLAGKAVVITGSGRGIGEECARLAAQEGAAVIVNDVDAPAVERVVSRIRDEGGRASGCVGDVGDWGSAERLIATCVKEYGAIDGLVNNAAIQILGAPGDLDEIGVRRLFEVNVLGSLFCGVHAIRRMTQQGTGSIINVTSGAHMGLQSLSAYGASKGAVASLTYCWANDLQGTGIRVNAVSPVAATRLTAEFADFLHASASDRQAMMSAFPAAADNAPVVAYLLSDRADDVSGQVIRIDSGQLSIVGRPTVLLPATEYADRTVDGVAGAIDRSLRASFMPLGLTELGGDFEFSLNTNRT